MASDSETTRARIRHFHRRDRRAPVKDISTPVLAFTDADSRDDIFVLPSRISQSGHPRPTTSDGTRTRKKIHVADLILEKSPQLPSHFKPVLQRPIEYDPDTIGIAIGSPTHWPWINHERHSIDSNTPSAFAPSTVASTMQSFGESETHKESTKRKLLSNIFGKPSSTTKRPFYQAQSPQIPHSFAPFGHRRQTSRSLEQLPMESPAFLTRPSTSSTRPVISSVPKRGEPGRRPSLTRRTMRSKVRMEIEEYPEEPPPPPPKDFPVRRNTILPFPVPESRTEPIALPQLTLDIPDMKMERYSVMFGSVLGKPKSTLLDRRQTQLKGLQISHEVVNETVQSPELLSARRATIPSPRSPRISLFPIPPGATAIPDLMTPRRSGLSRSNTLPSPHRPTFPHLVSFPQRKESHIDSIVSPSHGSETPVSMSSDWHSDDSRDLSDISDEDEREDCFHNDRGSEDIKTQFSDLPMPQGIPVQPKRTNSPISKYFLPYIPQARKVVPEVVHHAPRSTSRLRTASNQHPVVRSQSPALQRNQSLPIETLKGQPTDGQTIGPIAVKPQAGSAVRPFPPFNPLKSSPVSPTEITLARKLSQSRSHKNSEPVPRTARQPTPITIINPDLFLIPDSNGTITPHIRNKSQHVVVERA